MKPASPRRRERRFGVAPGQGHGPRPGPCRALRSWPFLLLAALLLSALSFPGRARADTPPEAGAPAAAAPAVAGFERAPEGRVPDGSSGRGPDPLDLFRKGWMTLQLQGTCLWEAWGVNQNTETLAGASVAYGYYFLDTLSLNLEALFTGVRQDGWNTFLAGLSLYPRWVFLRVGGVSLFMDAGIGISLASRRLPEPNGTEFNFLILAGPGFALRVSDAWMITGGMRYLHISNSSIQGSARNPSIDAVGFQVGVLFPF